MYRAPELIGNYFHDLSEDDDSVAVYSFGTLIYNLLEPLPKWTDHPRPEPYDFMQRIIEGWRLDHPKTISDVFWELITACRQADRRARRRFPDIVEEMKRRDDLVFPGTNMTEYREYQERRMRERIDDPRAPEISEAVYSILGGSNPES
jgi:hypothetical protein